MNTNETTNTTRVQQYRPKLTFYHPNAKGTGGALKLELHPAHDDTSGCIMASAANQSAIGSRTDAGVTFARFDWEHSVCVKLDFNDLCKILQVLRGECESIDEGRGLYHRSPRATTRIVFRHLLEPVQGYSLEFYRAATNGQGESRTHIVLNPAEALGLSESIAGAMAVISFGIPMVVPHDTSAYEAEVRRSRNVVAA